MKRKLLPVLLLSVIISSCVKKATCTCKKHDGSIDVQLNQSSNSKKDMDEWKAKCRNTNTIENKIIPLNDSTYTTVSYTTACEVS